MTAYAVGKKALGLCDRCGRQYLLRELKKQVYDQKQIELLVCPECLDVDHPQLQLGKLLVVDPQALRNPRPDQRNDVVNTPQLSGFTSNGAPVFNTQVSPALDAVVSAGKAPVVRRG